MSKTVEELLKELNSGYSVYSLSAAKELGKREGDPRIPGALISNALHDWSGEMRAEAVRSLGKLGSELLFYNLNEIIEDKKEIVRIAAVETLENFRYDVYFTNFKHGKLIMSVLEKGLKDESAKVQLASAKTLMKFFVFEHQKRGKFILEIRRIIGIKPELKEAALRCYRDWLDNRNSKTKELEKVKMRRPGKKTDGKILKRTVN